MGNYEKYTGDIKAINFIASTKINTFLVREHKKLVHSLNIPVRNGRVDLLHEICCEKEPERDRAKLKRISCYKLLHHMTRMSMTT